MSNLEILNSIGIKQNTPKGKRRGMLPSYWVNLDELAKILIDISNSSKLIDYGKQKIDGLIINVPHNQNEQDIIWQPKEEFIVLTGIEFSSNDVRNIGYDNSFDMYIDDELYFEDIYIKETDEYKRFNVRKLLTTKNKIRFLFKNKNNMIENIMFHIHYIGDIQVKKYNIVCIDIDTNKVIEKYEHMLIHPNKQMVCPHDIENYIKVSEECILLDTSKLEDNHTIEFYYKKEELSVNHNYDIICKLYWESDEADVDIHCVIGNYPSINYSNKNFMLDENNSVWLDFDYRKWEGNPEVLTILGFRNESVLIKLDLFAGILKDNESVKLTIHKLEKNNEQLLKEYEILGNTFVQGLHKEICRINLDTHDIEDLF